MYEWSSTEPIHSGAKYEIRKFQDTESSIIFKLGGVVAVGLATTFQNRLPVFAQNSKIDNLVQRYLSTAVAPGAVEIWNKEFAVLSAEELLQFNRTFADAVIQLASPHEPEVKEHTEAAFRLRNAMVQVSVQEYGKPFNQLAGGELFDIANKANIRLKATGDNRVTMKSAGKTGLMKPANQGFPCFAYTRNATLRVFTGLPNCMSYLQAAGAPHCADADLELRYSGYRRTMTNTNGNGAAYFAALSSTGRLQVLRDFSNTTGALIAGGSLFIFGGSWYIASISMRMD